MSDVAFVFIGCFLLLVAAVLGMATNSFRFSSAWFRAQRVRLRDAPEGVPVAFAGRILPSEAVTVVAPFSGRKVAWCRAQAFVQGRTEPLVLTLARDFVLEDSGRNRARIQLASSLTVVEAERQLVWAGLVREASPKLQEFLRARGVSTADTYARFEEERLSLGQEVAVAGTLRRKPAAPLREGYRDSSSTELVLQPGREGEALSVNAVGAVLLRARMRAPTLVCAGLGLALIAVGIFMGR
jgi:hypothetical protein